jgi:predicted chitinase/8-oxo-dGTP pyrophosphatase MutT (NUDIX family)/uncharacterized ParB-like nuclease family protein/FMN phosphatase YigB (HAD superfamily)
MNEHKIDNYKGIGAVPFNQDIDYFGLRVKMLPSVFLKLAAPLETEPSKELEQHIADGGAIGAPFLSINIPAAWDDGDFSSPATVRNHDGRNRMTIIQKLEGDVPVEVHIFPNGVYRARDLTQDFVKNINNGLIAEKSTKYVRGPLFKIEKIQEALKPMVQLSTDPEYFGATVTNHREKNIPLRMLPVDLINVFEPEDKMKSLSSRMNVSRLKKFIQSGGKIPPILVRKQGTGYQVVDGHHRLHAYKKLGIKTIPCRIVPDKQIDIVENDAEHAAELGRTGFWGKQGAGCIIMAKDTGRICLPYRSAHVQEPNTWGTWGGAIDGNEDPAVAAKREVQEEAGYDGPVKMVPLLLFKHSSGFRYFNFLALVEREFTPQLNWETQTFDWVQFGEWPAPLHPGLKSLLNDSASIQTIKEYADQAEGIHEDFQDLPVRKLVIFDIDDTLVHTDTKVHVIHNGKTVAHLNSHEFTHYKLKSGEHFDFGRFRDAQEFFEKSRPNLPMIKQLKQDIATGNKVVMVTAREDFNDREIFLNTFRRFGIDMSKVHVYRAGNIKDKIQTEEKKKIIIRKLLNQQDYSNAIMYDDAVPNLDAFISLKKEYPDTRFYAWHVSLDGEAHEYQRTDENLTEAATSVLFHYTSVWTAEQILKDQEFKLSSSTGTGVEAGLAPKGYPFFLSTTRSKVGDYHRYTPYSAAMFVLDGDWLNTHGVKTKPVDYWDRMWLQSSSGRTSESEDRIFSRTNTLPLTMVRELHLFIKPDDKSADERHRVRVRHCLILAKQQNIPVFLYTTSQAWLLQDKRRAVNPSEIKSALSGSIEPTKTWRKSRYDHLGQWLELMHQDQKSRLSVGAETLRYSLIYHSQYSDAHKGLENDMHNSRKPASSEYPEVVKINKFMMKHKISSVKELYHYLKDKWMAIDAKNRSARLDEIKLSGKSSKNTDAFMDEYYEQTNSHPFSSKERIYNDEVSIELSPYGSNIHLADIRSLNPRSGAGTRGLKFIIGLANKHGVGIEGLAKAYHTEKKKYIASSKRLRQWYLKHGFRDTPGTYGDNDQGYDIEYVPENFDEQNESLPSVNTAKSAMPRILEKVQRVYDDWDEADRDTYAGGGICHLLADEICDVLGSMGIECATVSCSTEQHVYVGAKFEEGVYSIDIPYHIYETGGGFSWQKIPDIKFEPNDVEFYQVSGDPDEFENYIGVYESLEEDWRKTALGVAASAAIAAGMTKLPAPDIHKAPTERPAVTQQVQPAAAQNIAQQKAIKKHKPQIKLQTQHESEKILYSIAVNEGLRGEELAQFLAQCKHETANFQKMHEIGAIKKLAASYAKKTSLGNKNRKDAAKFIGRGPLQITGRENYQKASRYLFNKFENEDPEFLEALPGGDHPDFLLRHPTLMADPMIGGYAAIYYWKSRVRPNVSDFSDTSQVTKQINPALRGVDSRQANYQAYTGNQG